MNKLNDLSAAFLGAQSIKYKPAISALFLEVPRLDSQQCSEINGLFKEAEEDAPLSLRLHFKSEKELSLTIENSADSVTIAKLRPLYSLRKKLEGAAQEPVTFCIYNYRFPGMFMGTKFKVYIV